MQQREQTYQSISLKFLKLEVILGGFEPKF